MFPQDHMEKEKGMGICIQVKKYKCLNTNLQKSESTVKSHLSTLD